MNRPSTPIIVVGLFDACVGPRKHLLTIKRRCFIETQVSKNKVFNMKQFLVVALLVSLALVHGHPVEEQRITLEDVDGSQDQQVDAGSSIRAARGYGGGGFCCGGGGGYGGYPGGGFGGFPGGGGGYGGYPGGGYGGYPGGGFGGRRGGGFGGGSASASASASASGFGYGK